MCGYRGTSLRGTPFPPQDCHRALRNAYCRVLRGWRFLMSEVPLWVGGLKTSERESESAHPLAPHPSTLPPLLKRLKV